MLCRSGKHDWIKPISAERCCDPRWSRELRMGLCDLIPGDADDGWIHVGGGQILVWHFTAETEFWVHWCPAEKTALFIGHGEPCNWCGAADGQR